MKSQRILLIFTVFISAVFCGKLTPEEDETRARTCGIAPNKNSTDVGTRNPWIAQLQTSNRFDIGIMISPRHIITQSSALIYSADIDDQSGLRYDDNVWKFQHNDARFDNSKCKNEMYEFSKEDIKNVKVRPNCESCMTSQGANTDVKSIYYFGNCKAGIAPDGILLVEFEPISEMYRIPICPATSEIAPGESVVSLYARNFLRDKWEINDGNDNKTKMITEKCVNPPHKYTTCVKTPCEFYSEAFLKSIKGRETLLYVNTMTYLSLKDCMNGGLERPVSVAYFKDKICQYAGVCKETIYESPKPQVSESVGSESEEKSNASNIFSVISILLILFLNL